MDFKVAGTKDGITALPILNVAIFGAHLETSFLGSGIQSVTTFIIFSLADVKIDINDDGKVVIYHTDRESINKAKEMIENIVRVKF